MHVDLNAWYLRVIHTCVRCFNSEWVCTNTAWVICMDATRSWCREENQAWAWASDESLWRQQSCWYSLLLSEPRDSRGMHKGHVSLGTSFKIILYAAKMRWATQCGSTDLTVKNDFCRVAQNKNYSRMFYRPSTLGRCYALDMVPKKFPAHVSTAWKQRKMQCRKERAAVLTTAISAAAAAAAATSVSSTTAPASASARAISEVTRWAVTLVGCQIHAQKSPHPFRLVRFGHSILSIFFVLKYYKTESARASRVLRWKWVTLAFGIAQQLHNSDERRFKKKKGGIHRIHRSNISCKLLHLCHTGMKIYLSIHNDKSLLNCSKLCEVIFQILACCPEA